MAIRPTFYGFELGRSALAASQRNIDITGQNIANINTPGFSRQRVNLASVGVGAMDKWKWGFRAADNVGMGVDMTGIQRVRDEFLDVRFWKDNSDMNRFQTKWDVLDSIEMLLDEFTMPNIQDGMFRFQDALQELNNNSDDIEYARQAMSIADILTRTLNKTAVDMETIVNDQIDRLALIIKNINHAAATIDKINNELRTQKIVTGVHFEDEDGNRRISGGFLSNELLDERDLLLDELSSYGNIRVRHEEGSGVTVYFGLGDEEVILVDGTRGSYITDKNVYQNYEGYFNLLSFERDDQTNIYDSSQYDSIDDFSDPYRDPFRVTWKTGDNIGNDVIVNSGQILGYYEMLNGIGDVEELDDPNTVDRAAKGIPYFLNMVNAFAHTFANTLNQLNNGGSESELYDNWQTGDLFDATDSGATINARNIRITNEWRANPYMILRSEQDDENYLAENDNILQMIYALKREDMQIEDVYGNSLFNGSFAQFAVSLNSEITIEVNYNNKQVQISEGLVLAIENLRDSIKSVNEDEEAMNLMKYSKSYNAAARFMTVLDEMLDLIVNRLGIVGR